MYATLGTTEQPAEGMQIIARDKAQADGKVYAGTEQHKDQRRTYQLGIKPLYHRIDYILIHGHNDVSYSECTKV